MIDWKFQKGLYFLILYFFLMCFYVFWCNLFQFLFSRHDIINIWLILFFIWKSDNLVTIVVFFVFCCLKVLYTHTQINKIQNKNVNAMYRNRVEHRRVSLGKQRINFRYFKIALQVWLLIFLFYLYCILFYILYFIFLQWLNPLIFLVSLKITNDRQNNCADVWAYFLFAVAGYCYFVSHGSIWFEIKF